MRYAQFVTGVPNFGDRKWLPSEHHDGDVPSAAHLFEFADGAGVAIASDPSAGRVG